MTEFIQIIIGIIFLIMVFLITRIGIAYRIRRAAHLIIQDLEIRQAFDHGSAAELPYGKAHYFRIGLRDYRPKALESLVQAGIVARTENGRFFLIDRSRFQDNGF
jgi:hypothetical protein